MDRDGLLGCVKGKLILSLLRSKLASSIPLAAHRGSIVMVSLGVAAAKNAVLSSIFVARIASAEGHVGSVSREGHHGCLGLDLVAVGVTSVKWSIVVERTRAKDTSHV